MDPRTNPYAPGAGAPPPELAGRDAVLETVAVALDRLKAGRPSNSVLLIGLRGVGKTVLLRRIATDAGARGIAGAPFEASEKSSLPAMLARHLRAALIAFDRTEAAKTHMRRAWRALAGFVGAVGLKYSDVELRIDAAPEPGLADTGDLESDLADLFRAVGEAARQKNRAFALFADELQYVDSGELAALIVALHGCQQQQLPVSLVGAGLPQLIGQIGQAKSYAERLFNVAEVGRLDRGAADRALQAPAERQGVVFADAALTRIFDDTGGYPYFIQEWGSQVWTLAETPSISVRDAEIATEAALAKLDAGFFRMRYDRCTPVERAYLGAMASLGPGPHRSGAIARAMGREVTSVAPTRGGLVSKGLLYGPKHGDTAFTVPMFDGFLKREGLAGGGAAG